MNFFFFFQNPTHFEAKEARGRVWGFFADKAN